MTVIEWLLDSDPSIRWQVQRDLTDEPDDAEAVAAERARVASEGWGARLLALQGPDGHWGAGDPNPEWVSIRALLLLRDMGLDPTSHRLFLAAAKFGPPPADGRGRGPMVSGSFSLLVVERAAP